MMMSNRFLKNAGILFLIFIPGAFFLVFPRMIAGNPSIAEWYAVRIFPILSKPLVFLSSLVPISLSEVVIIALVVVSPLLLVWYIYRVVRSDSKRRFFYRSGIIFAILFSMIASTFSVMHGINYSRYPIEKSMDISIQQRTPEELSMVMSWLVTSVTEELSLLTKDETGRTILLTDMNDTLIACNDAMNAAAQIYPVLSGNDIRPKPVALSHYWSYTGIVGMYFPFFGESNINVDVPPFTIPMTVCHELTHVRGIAREQDANFGAFIACISSDRADFRYSGYMFALGYIANDLRKYDPEAFARIAALIPDGAYLDWQASADYWKQFEGPVQDTSTQANDAYLKANLQPEGVGSYSQASQLIIAYYFMNGFGETK